MSKYNIMDYVLLGLGLMTILLGTTIRTEARPAKEIVVYIRTWELAKGGYWKAEDIQGEQLTTLNIAFAQIVEGTNLAINNDFLSLFEEIATLHKRYPHMRINLSIGGWGGDGFSDMALTSETRQAFIQNIMEWVTTYGFNGIDVDWEYPVSGGWGEIKARPEDKQNFTAFMTELRAALDALGLKNGQRYELSFAASVSSDYLTWIEPKKLVEVVDYVNVMCYPFYGSWSETTGHLARLYAHPDRLNDLSCDSGIQRFLNAGFLAHMLVLGVPFYGHAWKGVANENNGLYQEGIYDGDKTYSDILELKEKGEFTRYWDDTAKAPYLYDGDTWITYEDEQSLTEKLNYISNKGLRGIMAWEYAHDMKGVLLDGINKNVFRNE